MMFSFILFADDSNLLISHRNLRTLIDNANRELKSIYNWFAINKLSLNVKKTKYMFFSNSANDIPINIVINNTSMEKVDCIKFLGLYIDSKLTWKAHTNYLCKTIARNIGVINTIKHFIPPAILKTLYNTLILSYISNGILAWGVSSLANVNRLFRLQKRALRIINCTDYNAHTGPLFF